MAKETVLARYIRDLVGPGQRFIFSLADAAIIHKFNRVSAKYNFPEWLKKGTE